MTIYCPHCGLRIDVPEEQARTAGLRIKCQCGRLFPLADARLDPMPAPRARPPVIAAAVSTPPVPPFADTPPAGGGATGQCRNHRDERSRSVCPRCHVGYCRACETEVRGAVICPSCDGLCVPTVEHEQRRVMADQRARPLTGDLGTILKYPLNDPIAYVMLAVVTGFFSLFRWFGGIALVFSQGVLMWYSFQALSRVASGNMKDFMPDFGEIDDLVKPLRLGLAALVAASWPLVAVSLMSEGLPLFVSAPRLAVVHAQPEGRDAITEEEEDEQGRSAMAVMRDQAASGLLKVLLAVALLWKLLYTPMALTVAGLSRSVRSTLNPLIGLDTIRRMGTVYWQALGIYTALAATQWLLSWPFSAVPVAGTLIRGFIDAYACLCVGCTLGLAVFKKAPELGWD